MIKYRVEIGKKGAYDVWPHGLIERNKKKRFGNKRKEYKFYKKSCSPCTYNILPTFYFCK